MALLGTEELRGFLETSLTDDQLQLYLDDAEAEIVKRFGGHESQQENLRGISSSLWPSRPIQAITRVTLDLGDSTQDLQQSQYKVVHNGRAIVRKDGGYWTPFVTVEYTPKSDVPQRKRVQLDLVKLAIKYDGSQEFQSGNYQTTHLDYERERTRLLRRLESRLPFS